MKQGQETSAEHTDNLSNAAKGAVAGAAALWLMDRFDWFTYDNQDPAARRQTDEVRPGGLDPAHVMADNMAHALGTELGPHEPHAHPAGLAVHYALGIAPAALYGMLRSQVPALGVGRGSLFGLGLFLAQDEGLNTMLRTAADPRKYPWQAHARGMVAHMLFGLLTDTALNLMKVPRRAMNQTDAAREEPDEPYRPIPAAMPVERGSMATRH